MLDKEAAGEEANFGLPDELLQALPSDPFAQLDVARKITSIALSTRVSELESESSDLRAQLAEKEQLIADLNSQIESLNASLSETNDKLASAEQDKENLVKENETLSSKVRRLTRDVSKLEVFRKTLMQSLQEDDENSEPDETNSFQVQIIENGAPQPPIIAKPTPADDESSLPPLRLLSMRSHSPEPGNSYEDREADASRTSLPASFPLTSQTSTPRITPPGSPPSLSASVSPSRTSKPVSPRRHAMSFSTSRGMFDDRNNSGRARVDGKEFFRQVRSRLSYEQFGAFLANVKELNAHKQTREETLRKAEEIFGQDNKDLYIIFEGLITRNVH